ncbi:kinase-like domain-containing protein [Schizothecium vesticola]|uniref:non-specific serine/threonine protein kinase n=1 Tax=Schizothecium vesticola TaxID=314040 RepID=A0AA40F9G4_9PEZI|nr:kinase-like domain-containing protein [Schizothecium vesticola]
MASYEDDKNPDSLTGSDIAEENVVEFKSNGLRLELAPFELEHIYDYEPGGSHAVHLGDVFADAYRVIHKLGHGGCATVWLARDLRTCGAPKYVALKIIQSDASGDDCPELLLHRLVEGGKSLPNICLPLEHFHFDGPNGSHLCFVYPVLGPRVSKGVFHAAENLEDILRSICRQVTEAVASLHAAGICHGDLRPHNILHPITGLDGLLESEVLCILGEPRKNPVLDPAGQENTTRTAPRYLVYPVDWSSINTDDFISKSAQLIDFGESFTTVSPPEDLGTPGPYRSLELILDPRVFGIHSDLWALGCTLFEIRTGRKLIESFEDEDDGYLDAMCQILGKFPEPWWSNWQGRVGIYKDEADENGRAVPVKEYPPEERNFHPSVAHDAKSILDRLGPGVWYELGRWFHAEIEGEESRLFADLLKRLVVYRPEDRMSAAEVLRH